MIRYNVVCNFCSKKMKRTHFDVTIGALAFFLCGKHMKELEEYVKSKEK